MKENSHSISISGLLSVEQSEVQTAKEFLSYQTELNCANQQYYTFFNTNTQDFLTNNKNFWATFGSINRVFELTNSVFGLTNCSFADKTAILG